jgi:hypothetical protein
MKSFTFKLFMKKIDDKDLLACYETEEKIECVEAYTELEALRKIERDIYNDQYHILYAQLISIV